MTDNYIDYMIAPNGATGISEKRYFKDKEARDRIALLEQRLDDLEYVAISISSFYASPSTVEAGSTQTSITLSYTLNKPAVQMKLDDNPISNTATSGSIPLTGLSLTSNKTWTLKATDARKIQQDEWVSRTATITFTNKVKYGVAAQPESINDAFLNSLPTRTLSTSKIRSISVNAGEDQYIWYALPSSYGTCQFTVGGFTGGFTEVALFNHVNESGKTVEYRVYRSDNANLGSKTVSIT